MTDHVSDEEMAQLSAAWLAYDEGEGPEHEWALFSQSELYSRAGFSGEARFVLQLCADVELSDEERIGAIGSGPLEDLIQRDPDKALAFVEAEIETNLVMREALTEVWSQGNQQVRVCIDAILARYGKEGGSR
jgi:hypothetical protein